MTRVPLRMLLAAPILIGTLACGSSADKSAPAAPAETAPAASARVCPGSGARAESGTGGRRARAGTRTRA